MSSNAAAALRQVSLKDKFELDEGVAYMSGIQALTRLPIVQRKRDLAAGLNTEIGRASCRERV